MKLTLELLFVNVSGTNKFYPLFDVALRKKPHNVYLHDNLQLNTIYRKVSEFKPSLCEIEYCGKYRKKRGC
ncbi:protein of unknown function [Candidatus Nitrotoga arctica]|uniref:Uncharacterized protein n=1 Tax=Candidatus Nitrotoga arctica TaxID=453162 RepID=A0ABN8ASB3_9PROT|nr:protein of unknown function [Candidatus Nitrotoga arctica]